MERLSKESGEVKWTAPSNIALVKYWGKKNFQIPMNPSVSMTLKNSVTETTLNYQLKKSGSSQIEFKFENQLNEKFHRKVNDHFREISKIFPIINEYSFVINFSKPLFLIRQELPLQPQVWPLLI